MQEHLIIIGGVAAGTKAASKARRENHELKITLYTDEKHISYSACGMPYFIGNDVDSENKLLVRPPEAFREKENIDIKLFHRVTKIDSHSNKVLVKNLETDEEFEDQYTNLLIATGSRAVVPPIEGIDLNNVYKLKNIEDGKKINESAKSARKAVIIGGGYIGLELAESFKETNKETTIVEMAPQILSTFDPDLAAQIKKYMTEEKGVNVITDDSVVSLEGDEHGNLTRVKTKKGETIDADIAIIAVGVKPNVELAEEAGVEIGETGAIKVNRRMQTNLPNIYAAGDCAQTINRVTGKPAWVPLGSTANKQGRVAAINITGGFAEFYGVLGSAVTKIFDYTASISGINEKTAKQEGIEYELAIVSHKDRSGYMPGAKEITIKMLAEKESGRIIGIQAIGKGDADKRVNVVATAITAGMSVNEFLQTDLTYAPPYSPAIDPLLIAAQILEKKLEKGLKSISPQDLQKYLKEKRPCAVIDIRSPEEYAQWHLKQAKNMSSEELEKKIQETKPENLLICCDEGMRSYIESLRLKDKGCHNVTFIDGGVNYLKNIPEYSKTD